MRANIHNPNKEIYDIPAMTTRARLSVEEKIRCQNPIQITENKCGNNIAIVLWFVWWWWWAESARNMILWWKEKGNEFHILATQSYFTDNPSMLQFLEENCWSIKILDDTPLVDKNSIYEMCHEWLSATLERHSITWVLNIWYRTYFPDIANKLWLPSVIIDGALLDINYDQDEMWNSLRWFELEVFRSPLITFLVASGIPNNIPPTEKQISGMNVIYCSYPFSSTKLNLMKRISNSSRSELLEWLEFKNNEDARYMLNSVNRLPIVIPEMDHLYFSPDMSINRYPHLRIQIEAYIQDILLSTNSIAEDASKPIGVYMKKWSMYEYAKSFMEHNTLSDIELISPPSWLRIPLEERLTIRSLASATIGRAPQCVSSQEDWYMGIPLILTAAPWVGMDNNWNQVDFMDEWNAYRILKEEERNIALLYDIGKGESCLDALRIVLNYNSNL